MSTRTSTQARSHAQKFFVKIEKRNIQLDDFLANLDLGNLEQDMFFSDDEDEPAVANATTAASIMAPVNTVE